jgi:AraC family transcriptional regulator
MNYYELMEEVINYIEDNLYDNLSLEDISENNYISVPHLYRLFGSIVGLPIMSYVRNRRISNSVSLLKDKSKNILDIAFLVGFESHEVYTKAFKRLFGINPSKINNLDEIVLFNKFNINLYKNQIENEVKIMHTEIIVKEEFSLYVKKEKMNQAEQIKDNLINKFRTIVETDLKKHNKPIITAYKYDVDTLSGDDEDINYTYYAGIETKEPIKGYELLNVKSSKYAKFVYDIDDQTLNGIKLSEYKLQGESIENVYDFIDGIWVIESGYELSDNFDLEVWEKDKIIYLISIK